MPDLPTPAFAAYVAGARGGRNGLVRIICGMLVIALVWLACTIAAVMPTVILGDAETLRELLATPVGVAVFVGSVGSLWIGAFLALRLLHRRPLSSVFGPLNRIARRDFVLAFVTWGIVALAFSAVGVAIDGEAPRLSADPARWVVWFLPLVLLILIQASAEELVCRGYLPQSLGALYPTWLAWLLLPALLFAALHWNPELSAAMNAAALAAVAGFGLAMAGLVVHTGNLGAAFGAHSANNIVALLLVSSDGELASVALLAGRPIQDPTLTGIDAAIQGGFGLLLCATAYVVLTHRRSPLCLNPSVPETGEAVTARA